MNHGRPLRCRVFACRLAISVVIPLLICAWAVGAEPEQLDDTKFAYVEQILKRAGVSDADITKFKEEIQNTSPADITQLEKYLQQQPAETLAQFVEYLRHSPDDQYQPGPDSLPQSGVPRGKTFDFTYSNSKIFPGTVRKITVYVPDQYKADKPACVYVGLDGLHFAATTVFDNLIYKGQMPVTIGIGIAPGRVDSYDPQENPRFNRSVEFDGLNGELARFLLEEVFPEVERRRSPDGLAIRLSNDPNDRAVGGGSTGGIGAFTLAWERPNAFRRVFAAIGTFVGMRGGDRYPVLVRKTEPKPIRVFMQDGSNDELTPVFGDIGSWWIGNQAMERALAFAGYHVEHVWGEGSHNPRHANTVFPDAMRWLWKDWPQPIATGTSQNPFLKAILQANEGWEAVSGNYQSNGIMASDPAGELVFFDNISEGTLKVLTDHSITNHRSMGNVLNGLAFGPDSRMYASYAKKIFSSSASGQSSVVADSIAARQLLITRDNNLYVTEAKSPRGDAAGNVWLIRPNSQRVLLDSGLNRPSGIALSPDGLWLAVAENKTHWGYSYRVQPDGTVQDKQRFYWFHVPDTADDSGATAWTMDRDGRLYAATRMGVQVFDRNGRVRAVLPLQGGEATGLAFGGADFDTLYVSCADHRLYRRKLKVKGALPWSKPIVLPPWMAG